jgi:hypothetical protein
MLFTFKMLLLFKAITLKKITGIFCYLNSLQRNKQMKVDETDTPPCRIPILHSITACPDFSSASCSGTPVCIRHVCPLKM